MLAGSAQKPRCSTVLLDSSTLAGFCFCAQYSFCYYAHIHCDNQPNLSLRQLSYAATDGRCLHDSHAPNHTKLLLLLSHLCANQPDLSLRQIVLCGNERPFITMRPMVKTSVVKQPIRVFKSTQWYSESSTETSPFATMQ
jgi:hypothetical protein